MPKIYRYKNLSCPVPDNQDVKLTVKFISDVNQGVTAINIPGPNDPPDIVGQGESILGKGKDLRNEITVVFSAFHNPAPEEDVISIEYYINGVLLQPHANDTEEERNPIVILQVKFPKPNA